MVRFPYTGDVLALPRIGVFADRLPGGAPDQRMFAELALVDLVDPADADAFRRDTEIVGRGIVGANRDLFYLGENGVRRLALVTPF